jgi:hypothetical protein
MYDHIIHKEITDRGLVSDDSCKQGYPKAICAAIRKSGTIHGINEFE